MQALPPETCLANDEIIGDQNNQELANCQSQH